MDESTLRVLLVEDNENDAELILYEIKHANGYKILSERVESEDQFKAALHRSVWDAIICDCVLPQFSGERALELIDGYRLDTPVIIVSGKISREEAAKFLGKRTVHGYVNKNDLSGLGALFHREIQLSRRYDGMFRSWIRILGRRDQETKEHTERVASLTVQLARAMGISEIEIIEMRRGAILHDVGKISVPDNILRKTGELDTQELQEMRKHPLYAYEALVEDDYLAKYMDIPYCHHERFDGGGYPRGLKGEEIPLSARIFTVVDIFDAMTTDRPYRKALPVEDVLKYISEQSGKLFDPQVVIVFLKMFKKVETQ